MWNKLSTGKQLSKPHMKDYPYFLKDLIPAREWTSEFPFLTTSYCQQSDKINLVI